MMTSKDGTSTPGDTGPAIDGANTGSVANGCEEDGMTTDRTQPEQRTLQWRTHPHVVRTIADDSFGGWEKALVEAVKNSLDAKARRIKISVPTKELMPSEAEQQVVIDDNGNGMTFDELENNFCTFGRYKLHHRGTGKVGIFKVARNVEVVTRCGGKQLRVSFGTEAVLDARGGVEPETHVEIQDVALGPTGTAVTLSGFVSASGSPTVAQVHQVILRHFHHVSEAKFFINDAEFVASEYADEVLSLDGVQVEGVGTVSMKVLLANRKVPLSQPGLVVYANGQSIFGPELFGIRAKGYKGDADAVSKRLLGRIDLVDDDVAVATTATWTMTNEFKLVEDWAARQLEQVIDRQSETAVRDRFETWMMDRQTKQQFDRLPADQKPVARRILNERAKRASAGSSHEDTIINRLVCRSLGTDALATVLDILDESSNEDVEKFSELFKGQDKWTLRQVTRAASVVKLLMAALEELESCVADYTKNESAIHRILEDNPWILADDFHSFRSNKQVRTTLKVRFDIDVDDPAMRTRPDFFFILGDAASSSMPQGGRYLFVELKGPDQPLKREHQNQVVADACKFLDHMPGHASCVLIGTTPSLHGAPDAEAEAAGKYTFRATTYAHVIERAKFRLNYMVEGVKASGAEELARQVLEREVESLVVDGRQPMRAAKDKGGKEPFVRIVGADRKPFINCIPLYDIRASAGNFSPDRLVETVPEGDGFQADDFVWVAPSKAQAWLGPDYFVASVAGNSMNRRAKDGDWCVFRLRPPEPDGKPVLVWRRGDSDSLGSGRWVLKLFRGNYESDADGLRRLTEVVLEPDSTDPSYLPIRLGSDESDFDVVAELVEVLR